MEERETFVDLNSKMRICVDQRIDGVISGRIYCMFDQKERYFLSEVELLLVIDSICEEYNFPQATHKSRSFVGKGQAPMMRSSSWEGDFDQTRGVLGTFEVMVLFRHNATLQGSMHWMEKEKLQPFQSELELLLEISGAMERLNTDETSAWN